MSVHVLCGAEICARGGTESIRCRKYIIKHNFLALLHIPVMNRPKADNYRK